jgi:hypothetical protein
MPRSHFYTVRQPGLPRLSLQVGPQCWLGLNYQDIREYQLPLHEEQVIRLKHHKYDIHLRGTNLRPLYLSLLIEEVLEIPVYPRADLPDSETLVTSIQMDEVVIPDFEP